MIESELTTAVEAALLDLRDLIAWINNQSAEVRISTDDMRHVLAAGCFDIALEHQAAIASLTQLELHGSAHALLRVLTDSVFRGMYLWRAASIEDVERYQRDEFRMGIEKLVAAVERALAAQQQQHGVGQHREVVSAIVRTQWEVFCSFTHTGHMQITRRYTGTQLKPNYPDAEIIQALRYTGAMGLIALMELATLSNNPTLALATLERARAY